ncbi:amino acid ABC transporter ATP-binding protein [Paraburkholderia susongensis]|uniref:General L-amino acid transport system ATP-binding protein n=1 Tax=Paraburkholderia susongensis TaxID=1515439 RepID=A0A1X7M4J5_9BURK|nr:amino acid ABC transporter ATP-binding protein [Paraburkholderia susongensis]SMG61025.1 general L-amino acid transport system ATP-binding protein [Paraburkholderia susongensis]
MEPIISMRSVSKWYDAFQVLDDINLDVQPGEKLILCGPSGSGKSTTIRLLNRLEEHQKGNIVVRGVTLDDDPTNVRKVRADVGMVFQHFNLFPHLTALENCTVSLRLVRKLPENEANTLAMHYLERVKIAQHASKHLGQLSGGQKQRVAIARSLCMQPKIMLFDEPTSALDPEMVKEVLDTMVQLARDGMTMICVTHEMGFAREVGDRVVFMDHGKIVEICEPSRFFSAPQSTRAREFLGQIVA